MSRTYLLALIDQKKGIANNKVGVWQSTILMATTVNNLPDYGKYCKYLEPLETLAKKFWCDNLNMGNQDIQNYQYHEILDIIGEYHNKKSQFTKGMFCQHCNQELLVSPKNFPPSPVKKIFFGKTLSIPKKTCNSIFREKNTVERLNKFLELYDKFESRKTS